MKRVQRLVAVGVLAGAAIAVGAGTASADTYYEPDGGTHATVGGSQVRDNVQSGTADPGDMHW